MIRCRLLPTSAASGPTNMARDEALLRSALEDRASLRFYTWAEPTLSLGYFQPWKERSPKEVSWVRRPTGGDAILHHRELTYSLALPAGKPWHDAESWLCRMHHIIQATLKGYGVASRGVVCGEERRLGPYLCFAHQTPADLVIDGHKVVGSAQRRPHGATMQHGSILLARSEHAPTLPGIAELAGVSIEPTDLANRLAAAFADATGWTMVADDWTEEELATASELERSKYSAGEWNERR